MTKPPATECKTSTPWGTADYCYKYARGVIQYATPGHGGFKVAITKALQMPPALAKMGMNWGGALWFEEDCQYAAVMLAFPELFNEAQVKQAKASLMRWNHEAYEEFYGVVLSPEESHSKAEAVFQEQNKGKLVGRSARSLEGGMVKVWARPLGLPYYEEAEKAFLVPATEYATRSPFGFVIEPGKYQEVAV